jgi:hypothetical protein
MAETDTELYSYTSPKHLHTASHTKSVNPLSLRPVLIPRNVRTTHSSLNIHQYPEFSVNAPQATRVSNKSVSQSSVEDIFQLIGLL